MAWVLAFAMVFIVFGVLGVSQVNADTDKYVVSVSTYGDGVIEDGELKGTPVAEDVYTLDDLSAAATIQNADYMFSKAGEDANVFAVAKGVAFDVLIEGATEGKEISKIYFWNTWDSADPSKSVLATSKTGALADPTDHLVDAMTYFYPNAAYNAELKKVEFGEGQEVIPVLALDYKAAVLGEKAPTMADLKYDTDKGDPYNRVFLGMTSTEDYGGMLSQTNSQGMHIVLKADQNITAKGVKKTLSVKKVKKAKQVVKKAVKVDGAQTNVTFSKVKVNKKSGNFTVNKKNGNITVKKGTSAGTYKVTVKVKAETGMDYKGATAECVVPIIIK
jgi:hypothetical protein